MLNQRGEVVGFGLFPGDLGELGHRYLELLNPNVFKQDLNAIPFLIGKNFAQSPVGPGGMFYSITLRESAAHVHLSNSHFLLNPSSDRPTS